MGFSAVQSVNPIALSLYVEHLLRLRVLQELEMLAHRLQTHPHMAEDVPVLRRLTRAEFKTIRTSGLITHRGAIAVLVVPPLNKDPVSKERPRVDAMPLPSPASAMSSESPPKALLPSSAIYLTSEDDCSDLPNLLSPTRVPMYNGVSLFPSRPQRAALHERLRRLLFVERRARYRDYRRSNAPAKEEDASEDASQDKWTRGDEKGSHAFLLYSTRDSLQRADSVPLAIALWRLRMWEGQPWESGCSTWASLI